MSRSKLRVSKSMMGVLVAGALLSLSACAPAAPAPAEPSPTTAPASPTPEPYDGPIVAIGDELNDFLLAPEEIEALLPGVSDVTEPSSYLEQISDGGGAPYVPAICGIFSVEQSLRSVGARAMSWTVADAPERGFGRLHVLQFADEAQAQARMDQLVTATEQCAEFDNAGPNSFTGVVQDSDDGVRSLAGTLISEPRDWRAFYGFASVGNVLVELSQPFTGDQEFDEDAVATALAEKASEARTALIEQLTETPPADDEEQMQDGTAAWGDWRVTAAEVGSVTLGGTVEDALAATPGAEAGEPAYDGGPVPLRSEDGSATLSLQPDESGVLTAITIGADHPSQAGDFDGSTLPSAEGVRLGDTGADAMAAYPGGTQVWVVSAALSQYVVADRNGHLISFLLDAGAGAEEASAASIIGITVEDATTREPLSLG